MSGDPLLIAIMGAVIIAQRVELILERRSAARERRALCDRVQAGTLRDYVDYAPSAAEGHTSQPGASSPEREEILTPEPAAAGPPETGLLEARRTYDRDLMGERKEAEA